MRIVEAEKEFKSKQFPVTLERHQDVVNKAMCGVLDMFEDLLDSGVTLKCACLVVRNKLDAAGILEAADDD